MPAKLYRFSDPGRDHLRKHHDRAALELRPARCLDSEVRQVDHEPFNQGYIAGWQSVRGADDQPMLIPPCPVLVRATMHMVGVSRGARDARATIPDDTVWKSRKTTG